MTSSPSSLASSVSNASFASAEDKFDICCGICGGPLINSGLPDDEYEFEYDTSLALEDMNWLKDFRIISENLDACSIDK